MYVVLLFLCVCLTASKAQEFNPLGRGIYLPEYNLMGKLEQTGAQILLENRTQMCSIVTKEPISSQKFDFYKNTKSFYSSMTTSAGLSASLQADFTLGFTLDTASKGISGSTRTVTGNSLLVEATSYQTRLNQDCIQSVRYLDQNFLREFEHLPPAIKQPWLSNAWKPYHVFLRKYGSHVVTSITYGSSINQMAFADTAESYSERDFQVKSCLKLAGPTEIGKVNVTVCSGIEQSEIDKVNTMTMSDSLVIRGGTPATRNELIQHRTPELITKFMNEANVTNSTISYAFTSIWDLLQQVYIGVHDQNFLRAINLEYYYLGFLNYGCDYRESGGVVLQMFDFTKYGTPSEPEYECTLAHDGCHHDSDCHYKPIWCSCKGYSCVKYREVTLDTGDKKTDVYANTDSDWGWHNCGWKRGLAGSKCICYPDSVRKQVWSRDRKDTMYLGLHRQKSAKKESESGEQKEEL